ncbi:S-layer homology domain-containing protein [Salibacterium sp. K-3]
MNFNQQRGTLILSMNYVKAAGAAFLIAAGLMSQPPEAEAAESYTDVADDYWASGSIQRLSEQGVLGGYSDGTFAPGSNINRGQAAAMLVRAFDLETEGEPESTFEDLNKNSYFTPAAEAVKEAGLIGGKENNTIFAPDQNLSREQMASILVRAFHLEPQQNTGGTLSDLDQASNTHRDSIETLAGHHITKTPDNLFHPRDSVTRAQFAVFLERALAAEYTEEQGITGIEKADNKTIEVRFDHMPSDVTAGQFSFEPDVNIREAEVIQNDTVRLTVEETLHENSYSLYYQGKLTSETIETPPAPVVEDVMASDLKQVTITFNKDVATGGMTDREAYRLVTTGDSRITVEHIQAEENTVVLHLQEARPQGDTAVLELTDPVVSEQETYQLVFYDETP